MRAEVEKEREEERGRGGYGRGGREKRGLGLGITFKSMPPSDPLPSSRHHLLKFLPPLKTAPPTGDQAFNT